jgi:hypothetical protein
MMSIQVIPLLEGSRVITSVEADELRIAVSKTQFSFFSKWVSTSWLIIQVERSPYSGNQAIIALVRKKGTDALHAFHSALEATAQKELAWLLRAT